mgnify:CR=1 FL=1
MDKDLDISVVIPAYNEEKRIEKTIRAICQYLKNKGYHFEIIVVDDGSTDSTSRLILMLSKQIENIRLISHRKNMGKGAAVRSGVLASRGGMVLFTDADLSTPIAELEKMENQLHDGYDIVIGSRKQKGALIPVPQPWHRRVSGVVFHFLVRIILGLPFSDTQCGFKLFKTDVARSLFLDMNNSGFTFDIEILHKALTSGYRIKEIGVVWMDSPNTTVKFFKDPIYMFFDLLKIRRKK